jgi:hypothetical protein
MTVNNSYVEPILAKEKKKRNEKEQEKVSLISSEVVTCLSGYFEAFIEVNFVGQVDLEEIAYNFILFQRQIK